MLKSQKIRETKKKGNEKREMTIKGNYIENRKNVNEGNSGKLLSVKNERSKKKDFGEIAEIFKRSFQIFSFH